MAAANHGRLWVFAEKKKKDKNQILAIMCVCVCVRGACDWRIVSSLCAVEYRRVVIVAMNSSCTTATSWTSIPFISNPHRGRDFQKRLNRHHLLLQSQQTTINRPFSRLDTVHSPFFFSSKKKGHNKN